MPKLQYCQSSMTNDPALQGSSKTYQFHSSQNTPTYKNCMSGNESQNNTHRYNEKQREINLIKTKSDVYRTLQKRSLQKLHKKWLTDDTAENFVGTSKQGSNEAVLQSQFSDSCTQSDGTRLTSFCNLQEKTYIKKPTSSCTVQIQTDKPDGNHFKSAHILNNILPLENTKDSKSNVFAELFNLYTLDTHDETRNVDKLLQYNNVEAFVNAKSQGSTSRNTTKPLQQIDKTFPEDANIKSAHMCSNKIKESDSPADYNHIKQNSKRQLAVCNYRNLTAGKELEESGEKNRSNKYLSANSNVHVSPPQTLEPGINIRPEEVEDVLKRLKITPCYTQPENIASANSRRNSLHHETNESCNAIKNNNVMSGWKKVRFLASETVTPEQLPSTNSESALNTNSATMINSEFKCDTHISDHFIPRTRNYALDDKYEPERMKQAPATDKLPTSSSVAQKLPGGDPQTHPSSVHSYYDELYSKFHSLLDEIQPSAKRKVSSADLTGRKTLHSTFGNSETKSHTSKSNTTLKQRQVGMGEWESKRGSHAKRLPEEYNIFGDSIQITPYKLLPRPPVTKKYSPNIQLKNKRNVSKQDQFKNGTQSQSQI